MKQDSLFPDDERPAPPAFEYPSSEKQRRIKTNSDRAKAELPQYLQIGDVEFRIGDRRTTGWINGVAGGDGEYTPRCVILEHNPRRGQRGEDRYLGIYSVPPEDVLATAGVDGKYVAVAPWKGKP